MAASHYERLTALDAAFLEIEDENCPMHMGAVGIFEPGPLTRPEGGFDIERFTKYVESVLAPRYRQRLAWLPVTRDPVWVDDAYFNLHYHVRHLSLPHPGDERLLKRLAGHVMSLPLDRSKPLWELWVVEGLAHGRFAVITKTHHCMVDGVGTSDLMTASMQTRPDASVSEPKPWKPRRAPGALGMAAGELRRRADLGLSALGAAADAVAHPLRAVSAVHEGLAGLGETLAVALHRVSPTPFNIEIGPHRRFDWLRYDLDDVKEVKNRLGATVNDLVLANVAGALRSFLIQRGEDVSDLDFRAMVPVNIRTEDESGRLGNRVATVAAPLPLGEPDPGQRLARVVEAMGEVKASRQVGGMEMMEEISEWGLTRLFTQFARLTAISRPFNVVVTNVPGPQIEAYLLGCPLREAYPLVPLYKNQALGIALFSYHGGLFWGLNADWDALPDLHVLVEALALDFEELKKAAQA
ncbi:MAG: wax ester/triacylglycerol synthase family O-acyltransferase [Myxococcota bacterium]